MNTTSHLYEAVMLATARRIARLAVDSEREPDPYKAKAMRESARNQYEQHRPDPSPGCIGQPEFEAFTHAIAQFAMQFREEGRGESS